jgi:twitching motility protein PilT
MNAGGGTMTTGVFEKFHIILRNMVDLGASDLHISIGGGFRIRLHGELLIAPETEEESVSPADIAAIAAGILIAGRKCTRETVSQFIDRLMDYDCSYTVSNLGRFRVNIARQLRSLSIVLRHIPFSLPTFESLRLPPVLADIAGSENGLILLTGITGSGKSSTMAAMIHYITQNSRKKIVTIEDPVEFMYKDGSCNIIQRECGSDTESFARALRAALRQDPDIILVGEMRDKETIDIAIKAAETGHLVLSTVHTTDAPKTISRLISVFDPSEQGSVRLRLAETLVSVISQRLIKKADGSGRIVACEIMRRTQSIQECISDPMKTDMMKEHLERGRELYGMQTFDQHLMELYSAGDIDLESARAAATSPADFERNLVFK